MRSIFTSRPTPRPDIGRIAEDGEVQIANDIPPAMIPRIDGSDQAHVEAIETTRSVYLQMNVDAGPTADVRVRKGLNAAVDVESIIKNLFRGHAYGRDKGFVLDGMEGYQGAALKPYTYDPALAKKLFIEAGYPDGFPIDLWFPIGRYLLHDKEASGGDRRTTGESQRKGDAARHGARRWLQQVGVGAVAWAQLLFLRPAVHQPNLLPDRSLQDRWLLSLWREPENRRLHQREDYRAVEVRLPVIKLIDEFESYVIMAGLGAVGLAVASAGNLWCRE